MIPSRRLDLTNLESITKGRAGVESTYNFLYEFIIKLISAGKDSKNIGTLASSPLYSYFIGPSAIKAILDSGPLGEGVLSAIDNNLCSCFEKLSIVEQDITDYLKIFKELDKTSWKATQSDIIKFIDFWIVIEYCRVFQLVSSDVLGAVNGFIPLRAIIDHTGFTGFITIPKGNGGVLGIDNKICAYALFLNDVLYGQSGGFLTGTDDVAEYLEMITLFTDQINASNIFLNRFGEKGHENIIHSVKSFIEVLKTKNDGSLRGEYVIKDDKFVMAYNTYKIITLFAAFIENNDSFFEKIIDKIKSSYDPKEDTNIKSPAIKSSRAWITWVCFQLSRYQQTQKVFDKVTYDPPPIPINNDYKNIIDSFEERRIKYCSYIKKNRKKYLEAWYKSLQEVYINEAFAGHDNNSYELTLAATKAFGVNSPISTWLKPFITPKANAKGNEIYREDPEKVIKKILQETRCIPLLESYFSPDNIHNWALGNFGPKFINDREYDKTKTKFPVFNPTMEILDIITGIKGSGLNSTTFIVVDLAKYVPDSISIQRSIEQVNTRDNIDTADDIFDANIFFRNKLIEKKIIDNITTSTVYAPIIYGVDAAAFKLPKDAVYITGELKLPIDVGNGIKMVITFTTGEKEKKLYKLISDKPEQIEVTQGFENYGMSLNYLYKNTINNPPNNIIYGNNRLTKETYRPYIIDLYNNINSVKYETFLKAVIPKFPGNKYKYIFTTNKTHVGKLWGDFINEIIEKENVYIARAFIETIIDNKDLYTNSIVISQWKKIIDNFIKIIEEHKYNTFESSGTLMSAKLQTLITTNNILFCKCKIENGDIKFEIATFEDVKQNYPEEFAKDMEIAEDKGIKIGIAASALVDMQDLKRPLDADADADTDNNPSKKPRIDDITSVEGLENDISSTEEELEENTDVLKNDKQSLNKLIASKIQNIPKITARENLIKITEAENLELVDKLDILQKQMTAITTLVSLKGAPVGGGLEDTNIEANPNIEEFNQLKEEIKNLDEERKKIDIKLAELKQQKEEIKINMLTITDEPLTEVDLAKTFLFLGPELYEKLAIIEVEKINSIYNKVLSLNVDNIPIDVKVPQSDIILQDNLSMIELENTIVAVKFKDGKYYIESAEKYLQPEQGTLPTTLVEVQEVLTDALTGVKDAVETGYEKLTDAVSPMVVDEGIVEDFETVSPMAAAAAGGSKKHTKKHKSHIKKFTKRKYNKQKLNHTNRKGRKKAKRTIRKK